ncbi:rhodanese-like domain-containing protein [Dehalogenimonas etheniformans]|uniref:Rhodanese-like domain-containing protein n=1 Tax=Dehalogenimonas etheniformans TaxID=1536648 RepID=A0A2P5P911_9CHLR|nr:rhodanese-like domain-containing protein [Dehalogenimonas etheniformans]PPD58787.1 rhodanese-like domain-containing protein [Dehalogenimonas etheniformans]QNT76442.1 rhodanese-like domain-containing protein [Dehalogenimonas etheniformans]
MTAAVTVTIVGCAGSSSETSPNQTIRKISVSDASALIHDNAGKVDFFVLDVRTPSEFNQGHLAGAINIDYNAGNFQSEVGNLDRNKRYLVYCRTLHRSGLATDIMKDLGFTEAYDMDGGTEAWLAAGYPVV